MSSSRRPSSGIDATRGERWDIRSERRERFYSDVDFSDGIEQEKFFDSNGVRIRYVEQCGDSIVLIHGNEQPQLWSAAGVLPNLAQDYRVIALDARGHGRVESPDPNAYAPRGAGFLRCWIISYTTTPESLSMGRTSPRKLLTNHAERFTSATWEAPRRSGGR